MPSGAPARVRVGHIAPLAPARQSTTGSGQLLLLTQHVLSQTSKIFQASRCKLDCHIIARCVLPAPYMPRPPAAQAASCSSEVAEEADFAVANVTRAARAFA